MNCVWRLMVRYEDWRRKVEQGVMFEIMDIQNRAYMEEEALRQGFVVIEREKEIEREA